MRNGTPLHRAAFDGDAKAVADLLDQGADIGALAAAYNPEEGYSVDSLTPLHLAASDNPVPTVAALLLERGADVNAKDGEGETPCDVAGKFDSIAPGILDRLCEGQ